MHEPGFERAGMPGTSDAEINRLLTFVVVGGGPTSCEFVAELSEFLQKDVARWYPDLTGHIKVMLVEAGPGLLASFEQVRADGHGGGGWRGLCVCARERVCGRSLGW